MTMEIIAAKAAIVLAPFHKGYVYSNMGSTCCQ